jgi:hypothetical protein
LTLRYPCTQFLTFAQVDKRPVVEEKPPADDDDSDLDDLWVPAQQLLMLARSLKR